jgi:hypothetical protein
MRSGSRLVIVALLLLPAPAAADDWSEREAAPPPPSPSRSKKLPSDRDFGVFDFEAFATRLSVPPMGVNDESAPRRLVGAPAPAGSATLGGGGIGVRVRANHLVIPVVGLRYAQSTGATREDGATANGAPITVRRGDVHVLQIDLPFFLPITGFQSFGGDDAWKFSLAFLWGATHTWTSALITESNGATSNGDASTWTAAGRLDAAFCVRLDADRGERLVPWGCLSAAPTLFDSKAGMLPGGSVGLRIDL